MSEENLVLLIFYLATIGATIYLFTKSFDAYSSRDKSVQSPKGDYETSDWRYTYTYLPRADVKAKLLGKMEDEELDKDAVENGGLRKDGVTLYTYGEKLGANLTEELDMIEHPPHYNAGKFETIDVIEDVVKNYKDSFVAYCIGNVLKYISRSPFKGTFLQDLKKAQYYLNAAITYIEEKKENEVR